MALDALQNIAVHAVYGFEGLYETGGGISPLKPAHADNHGFSERKAALFLIPAGSGWCFYIDDEPLNTVETQYGPAWFWQPAFYAGEVTAELRDAQDRVTHTYILDVAPSTAKLGRDIFYAMLNQVWVENPALVLGEEPSMTSVGLFGDERSRLLAFARLRRYGPPALNALAEITQSPIQTLRGSRELASIYRVRRVDRRTAAVASLNPALIHYFGDKDDECVLDENILLDVPVANLHMDSAANRCITAVAQGLLRSVDALLHGMKQDVENERYSETRTSLVPRWPVRQRFLEATAKQLRTTLRKPPYSAVSRAEITAAGLNAVSAHPLYSRAYRLTWSCRRRGIRGDFTDERLWTSPTWEIYENWCYVRLAELLKEKYSHLCWSELVKHSSRPRSSLEGTDGQGTFVRLFLQPSFVAGDHQGEKEFRSVSGNRIPDIVLTQETPDGSSFHVFDAKYRSSRESILKAMTSAHVYRDSLRWNDRSPNSAVLLTPAANNIDWLLEPEHLRDEGVGVVIMNLECGREMVDWLELK